MSQVRKLKLVEGAARAANIPSVDRLLHAELFAPLLAQHGRTRVTALLRGHLAELRRAARAGTLAPADLTDGALAKALAGRLTESARPALKRVFNLTGTVLHTDGDEPNFAARRAWTRKHDAPSS